MVLSKAQVTPNEKSNKGLFLITRFNAHHCETVCVKTCIFRNLAFSEIKLI